MATISVATYDKPISVVTQVDQSGNAVGGGGSATDPVISKAFAPASADIVGGPITLTNADQALFAAGAAGIKNHLTGYSFTAGSTWTANTLQFRDGTTVKWELDVLAGAGIYSFSFPTPIHGTAATAFNVKATGAVTGTLKVNAVGYTST